MCSTNNKHYFLAGGGEMGELTRTKDWSTTSLGHPDTWPQSLRTTLSIILNSKFPMFLWWGPELICFYNDAYRPSLGKEGKHPKILGQQAEDAWSEIWSIIFPLIKNVLDGEGGVWRENQNVPIYRNGKIEDVYWTFSYSPIHDESDKIAGVLVTCNETTENIETLKKLEESNNRYLNNMIQAPTALCVLRGKNHMVEIVNAMMLELWGKSKEDVINKPIFEGIPEARGQGLEALLDKIYETGEKFIANERPVNLPRHGKIETFYINFVYEALREADGTISGIVAIALDVTEQVLSRSTIEEGEHKVRALVESAPFAIAVYTGEDMIVELANEAIINIWGKGKDVIGKSFMEVLPELDKKVFSQVKSVYKTGKPFHTENTPLDLIVDGKLVTYYFNYGFTPLYDLKGNIYGVMNTGVDLTELNLARIKIEDANKRFRNTVKQAPVGISILRGSNYMVEMANEAYLKLVDREEIAFVGRPIFDALPEVEQTVKSVLDNVLLTGIPFHGYEVPVPINRQGKEDIFYFDFLYHPLKEENGEITGIIVTVTEVTEKIEIRKKSQQNEQRLSIIVEASELGTWEWIVKDKTIHYSKRYLEIIGGYAENTQLTHEELVGHVHPEDLPIREKALKKAIDSGYLHYEARVIWNDQSIHWVEAKGKVFYDTEKRPEKLIGTARDITELKKHQQELEESEQKFRLLASSMPQHVWTSDTEGNLNYFNESVYNYSGLTPQQVEEGGWIQIVHPDDVKENLRVWMKAVATGNNFIFEHRFRRYDGEYRWQLSRAIPQIDENGKIQMWVGTSTDIQEQKIFTNQLENLVRERTKELILINESLEKSEERYHRMVEDVQDYAIFYLNSEGIIENWNRGAQKIKGYKAEEIVGKSFTIFYTESDKKRGLPQKLLKLAKEKGKINQEGWRVKKNGSLFWANVVITAVHDKKKKLIGYSKVTHDLSEKKKADDRLKLKGLELEQKNKELELMNKELQSFAYISSHDLQEPLRKIQTFATQIIERESDNLSDSGKDKFMRMQNAAHRMQTLINDLLAYSRTNIQERIFEKANINAIIEEVKGDLKEELDLKKGVIENNVIGEVEVIPFQFRQLIYNLVSNSIRFSRPNVPLHIKISGKIDKGDTSNNSKLSAEKDYYHISISDNGIGFEQQYVNKIFEVFQRLHGRSEYAGTGIGLAIVKKIVENHHGIITATGEQNKGATFDIYIPILK